MKLKVLLPLVIVALCCTTLKTEAQYYFYNEDYYDDPVIYEAGASLGVMNCLTDLGGHKGIGKKFIKDLNIGNTRFAASIYFNATYQMAYGLRFEATMGTLKAYDSILVHDIPNTSGRYERNLNFKTKIAEASLIAEFYPTYMFRKFDSDVEPPRAAPYLMIGVGVFHFNPQTKYHGTWIDLQPLHTEGEGFKETGIPNYSLTQMNIPMGIGIRYEVGPRFTMRAEMLYRKLSTDYLDDVSGRYIDPALFPVYLQGTLLQEAIDLNSRAAEKDPYWASLNAKAGNIRGNPTNNDAYFTFSIKFGYILGRKRLY
jgi:hypothetical protein